MSLQINTILPEESGLILSGDEKSLYGVKKLFEEKPHLFVQSEEVKEVDGKKEMTIRFPSATREAVEMLIIDFNC